MNNVDTTKTITHLGLCAGYGGIELGLKRVLPALRTIALCEIEAFACANLLSKMEAGLMDPAPIWSDLKTFPWAEFRDRVDILSGGYPCQPFSAAGKRLGAEDPRHLWPYIAGGIRILRPRVCFFENVEGHITLGLSTVISDLEELGYRTTFGIFSASEVGAPHQRKRVFVLAHSNGSGLEGHWRHVAEYGSQGRQKQIGQPWPSRPGEPQHEWEPPRVVAHPERGRGQGSVSQQTNLPTEPSWSRSESVGNAKHAGLERQWHNTTRLNREDKRVQSGATNGDNSNSGKIESPLGGDAYGTAGGLDYAELCVSGDNRTDELRLLGNGVVPATAERAFRVLLDELIS